MPINWKLRELLKERGGNNAAEISRTLEQTGYQLSTQAVCDLLNRQPKMIRLETIQALCEAFYITVANFLEVLPSAAQKSKKKSEISRGGDATQILTKVFSNHHFRWLLQLRKKWILLRSIQMHESF